MKRLADAIQGKQFDWYVAITRGGLVPACLLAQITGQTRIDTVSIHHYTDRGLKIFDEVAEKDGRHFAGKTILLIDDLVDSGDTMREAVEQLRKWRPTRIETAVCFKKQGSLFEPDYFIEERPGDRWINFPWEKSQALEEV